MPAHGRLFGVSSASILISALLATPVQAQTPQRPIGGESPLAGVRLHAPAVGAGRDASSIEVNPAGLAWLPAWSIRLHHSEMRAKGRVGGTGSALFAAAPLPVYRKLVFGASVSWLRPSDAIGYPDIVKLGFAAALRPKPWLSMGVAFQTLICDGDDAIDGLGSLDVGLGVRPLEWLSIGATLRNLNTPTFAGLPLARVYDLEVALRPLATRRLELGLGFALHERRGTLDPHARLAVEPIRGLRLFAHAELLRRDYDRDGDRTTDLRITSGLAFDFERLGFALSTVLGRSLPASATGPLAEGAARSSFQGAALSLSFRGDRLAPLIEGRPKLIVLKLSKGMSTRRLLGLMGVLREVERRPDIAGVLLHIDGLGLGWGNAQELRAWVTRLRRAKKRVYAFLGVASARQYYAVAGADRVFLDPAGGLRLAGLSSARLYFRGLFDKVGARPQFIRIAEYKSAPESYTRKGPSAPALRVQKAVLDSLYGQLSTDLAKDRGLKIKRMREVLDLGPFTPAKALEAGLVDELVIAPRIGRRVAALAHARLWSAGKLRRTSPRWAVGPQIAVISIEGDIVQGKSSRVPLIGRKVVGDKTIVRALSWARGSATVKAIVLRINSPGGSAVASDRMWRAVRAAARYKPVIVSMGNVAASGGYFAAAGGHTIYALPATITGSIGIFSGKFDLSGLLAKIGVTVHREQRGKRASMESFTKPYTDEERRFILSRLRYYYDRFLAAVGKGRKMKVAAVDKVARGRVWTGAQARKVKLVDRYGGLTAALEDAKRRAGLEGRPVRLVVLPKVKRSWLRLASRFLRGGSVGAAETDDAPATKLPSPLRELVDAIPPSLFVEKANTPLTRLPVMLLP
jgi:protease-4